MKNLIIYFLILLCFIGNCFAQDNAKNDSSVYGVHDIDVSWTVTDRNSPDIYSSSFKIEPCRKGIPVKVSFKKDNLNYDYFDCSGFVIYVFNQSDCNKKACLYNLIFDSKDPKYFDLLAKLVLYDTIKYSEYEINGNIRLALAKCLGFYNTNESKEVLKLLLNNSNSELATISAICLVQLGEYDLALDYFEKKYFNISYSEEVYSALMQINTPRSVEILKTLASQQNDKMIAIDAFAALSLLGYCDYAFEHLKALSTDEYSILRSTVIYCLAYYIGTKKAFEVIEGMVNDSDSMTKNDALQALKVYNMQFKKP